MTDAGLLSWAPYKVSLAGEHAVGYGGRSIVAAIDVGLTLNVHPVREGSGRFRCGRRSARWTRSAAVALAEAVDGRFAAAGASAWRKWRGDWFAPFRYVVGSWSRLAEISEFEGACGDDGWAGAGLGTSSASAAALSEACATLAGRRQSAQELSAAVRLADRLRHGGIPSGVDGEVVARGGLLSFAGGRAVETFPVPAVELVLVHSGVARDCNEVIARFAARGPRRIAAFVREMERLTDRVAKALGDGDANGLFAALDEHYPLMSRHDLGERRVTGLIQDLRRHGARAAKLTGAGRGGVVVAFCPPGAAAGVHRFCAARGLRALSCSFSNTGCRVDPVRAC